MTVHRSRLTPMPGALDMRLLDGACVVRWEFDQYDLRGQYAHTRVTVIVRDIFGR